MVAGLSGDVNIPNTTRALFKVNLIWLRYEDNDSVIKPEMYQLECASSAVKFHASRYCVKAIAHGLIGWPTCWIACRFARRLTTSHDPTSWPTFKL